MPTKIAIKKVNELKKKKEESKTKNSEITHEEHCCWTENSKAGDESEIKIQRHNGSVTRNN